MAETRKYEPTAGDPIGDAVRAALGETIRPVTPGAPAQASEKKPEQGRPTIQPMGSFVFTSVPKPPASA